MVPKMKFLHVNWESGMNIGKEHFIQQENAFTERIHDSISLFLNRYNYGLIPTGIGTGNSVKAVLKVDNQKFLKTTIFCCRAISPGGARIEILEENPLPEISTDLSEQLEAASKEEGVVYYVLLTVEPFARKVAGEPNPDEDPPRFPHVVPSFKVHVISGKALAKEGFHPHAVFIGKLQISQGMPEVLPDYIPPCMTLRSHPETYRFYELTEAFIGQLELNLLSIIRKINEKRQDASLAKSVFSLAGNLLRYLTENFMRFRWEISDQPPIALFAFIAGTARVIRNAIDSLAASDKEELLNYFTNWSELKQGDFEKLLVYCINFNYTHYDILFSIEQFSEYNQIIALLFDKLESLAYIGKKKETNIFVKEQTSKRSFLAD
jgi:hypothetical protein